MLKRRSLLAGSLGALALSSKGAEAQSEQKFRHAVMAWCYQPMKPVNLARAALKVGVRGIEGLPQAAYPAVMAAGMKISMVSGAHSFKEGPCNPEFIDKVRAGLLHGIELAKQVGSKKLITFPGMRFPGMDDEEAVKRCVALWKEVVPAAEKAGITLVLEHLSSRDDSAPMKGHPGCFGDDVDFCFDLVRRVGSPNFKLLFDIYHVSVMNGDLIRRIRDHHELIGHYHTAGNPGRGELDDQQEIQFAPVIAAIEATGYDGWLAHEFIPTWDDPIAALSHAVKVCGG